MASSLKIYTSGQISNWISKNTKNSIDTLEPTVNINDSRLFPTHLRRLWNTRIQDPETMKKLAATTLVANKTIYGAIIAKFPNWKNQQNPPPTVRSDHFELYKEMMRNMTSDLPFVPAFWSHVHTKLCPQNQHAHFRHGHLVNRSENGLPHSHFQVWHDFQFFDDDVLGELRRGSIKPGDLYSSTDYSSHAGSYQAYSNGTLLRNGVPFKDEDILVVMEDISEVAIVNGSTVLIDELSKMNTDIVFLGWCDGASPNHTPSCIFAYALTRKAARFLVQTFEPCSLSIEELFARACKNDRPADRLTWRLAHSWSYSFNDKYPRHGDKTTGLFHKHRIEHFHLAF